MGDPSSIMNKCLEKRVAKELQKLQGSTVVTAVPREDDLRLWDATIPGPVDSPYEGGVFCVSLPLPVEYPFKPPKPQFRTQIYHPNIKSDGTMCSAWLDSNWRPNMFLREVLEYTYGILATPDPDDAIEPEVANLFVANRQEYEKTAKEWTAKYAIPEKSAPAEETEPAEEEKLAKQQGSEPAEDEKAEKGKEVKGKSPQNNKRKRKAGAAGKR